MMCNQHRKSRRFLPKAKQFRAALLVLGISAWLPLSSTAQAPEKMTYQAVVRNGSGNLVAGETVGVRISILDESTSTSGAPGDILYQETHTPTTNANGLFTVVVGTGDGTGGLDNFSSIDWGTGEHFIQSEIDPDGGTTYSISGVSQLVSVPYALNAKNANMADTAAALAGISTDSIATVKALTDSVADLRSEIAAGGGISTIPDSLASDKEVKAAIKGAIDTLVSETALGMKADTLTTNALKDSIMNLNDAIAKLTKAIGYFDFKGKLYGTVTTSRGTWLDRNLGADRVATSVDDSVAYGDLYQWGRAADGHEKRDSDNYTKVIATGVGNFNASGNVWDGKFVLRSGGDNNWLASTVTDLDDLWQGVSSVNNPCPSGYRIPTQSELEAELGTWSTKNAAGAYASPLKLPYGGYRNRSDGVIKATDSDARYWSSTLSSTDPFYLRLTSGSSTVVNPLQRSYALSVRCIKN